MVPLLALLVLALLLLVPGVSAATGLLKSPWPQYRCDARHTGQSQYSTGYSDIFFGEMEWHVDLGDRVGSSPAVSIDGIVVVGCDDGNLYAISQEGEILWSFATGGGVTSSPALDMNGTVYVGSRDGNLYAVTNDGHLKWKVDLDMAVVTSPSIGPDGTIYVGNLDGVWYAVSPGGVKRWSLETEGYMTYASAPVGDDGTVYMVEEDGHWLYAMDRDGSELRRTFVPGIIRGSPVVTRDGTVYVNTVGGQDFTTIYAVSPEGGIIWTFNATGLVSHAPALGNGGILYFGTSNGAFYALNADGTVRWSHEGVGNFTLSSPAIDADGVVFAGQQGGCLAIVLESSVQYDLYTGDEVWSSPAIGSDGRVYFGSNDGYLYAFKVPGYEGEPTGSVAVESGSIPIVYVMILVAIIIGLSAVASVFGLLYRGYGGWRADGQVPPHAYDGDQSRMYPGEEEMFHAPQSGRIRPGGPPP